MDDLISRQAAIEAVCDLPDCPNGYSDTYDKARIIGVLEDVPSAQRWIPVTERLPDTTDFVLTINIVSQCGVYRFDGDCWLDYDGLFVNEGIRAWMPLPEPWRGEA